MKNTKLALNRMTITLSSGISLIISLCGSFIFPVFFDAGTMESNKPNPAIGSLIILAAFFSVVFLFALFFSKLEASPKRKTSSVFGGLLLLFVIGFVAMLIVSALYGLLAVLIHAICKSTMTTGQIKGIINITTNIITLSVFPIALNIFLTYAFSSYKALQSISKGIKTIKGRYLKLLLIPALLYATGFLIGLPFNYAANTLPLQIVKALIFALLGAVGILLLISNYKPEHMKKEKAARVQAKTFTKNSTTEKETVNV